MKKNSILYISTGISMIISALYTYIPMPEFRCELTFLFNMVGGALFIVEGIFLYKGCFLNESSRRRI